MNRWDEWKAQEPADGFASRTVAAALRERATRRRFDSRRWAGLSAAAGVMVAGVAWGSWAHMRVGTTEVLQAVPSASVAPRGEFHDLVGHPSREEQLLIEQGFKNQVPAVDPSNKAVHQPSRRVSPGAKPDAGYHPMSPHCTCMPGDPLCSCLGPPGPYDGPGR